MMKYFLTVFLSLAVYPVANARVVCVGFVPFGNTSASVKFDIADSFLDSTVEYTHLRETYKSTVRSLVRLDAGKNALFFKMSGIAATAYGVNISIVYPLQLNGGSPLAYYKAYSNNSGDNASPPYENAGNAEYQVPEGTIICK